MLLSTQNASFFERFRFLLVLFIRYHEGVELTIIYLEKERLHMEKQLTRRQLLTMKRKNLELKVRRFWNDTQNTDLVIEYIVAILVKNALVKSDFSQPCPDIVRELLSQAEPSETFKKFCIFLKDYVEEHEWSVMIKRVFQNENNYYKATKKMRLYEGYLKNRGRAVINQEFDCYTLVSIFLD